MPAIEQGGSAPGPAGSERPQASATVAGADGGRIPGGEAIPGAVYRWTWLGNLAVWPNDCFIVSSMVGGETHDGAMIREHLFPVLREARVIIDVGAHLGSHCIAYAMLSPPESRIFAFEPQRAQWALLRHNLERHALGHKVSAQRAAVGHRTRAAVTLAATVADGPGSGQPIPYGSGQASNLGGLALGSGGESVPMVALDDRLGDDLQRLDLLKVDAEGAEPFVLLGAERLIRRWHPVILLEQGCKGVTEGMRESVGWGEGEVPDALSLLRRWGYSRFQAVDDINLLCR